MSWMTQHIIILRLIIKSMVFQLWLFCCGNVHAQHIVELWKWSHLLVSDSFTSWGNSSQKVCYIRHLALSHNGCGLHWVTLSHWDKWENLPNLCWQWQPNFKQKYLFVSLLEILVTTSQCLLWKLDKISLNKKKDKGQMYNLHKANQPIRSVVFLASFFFFFK